MRCVIGCYGNIIPSPYVLQRLCEIVCGPNVPETMSLLCSGARVLCHSGDPHCSSPISLAERAGQAMQTEFLRHNEYTGIDIRGPGSKIHSTAVVLCLCIVSTCHFPWSQYIKCRSCSSWFLLSVCFSSLQRPLPMLIRSPAETLLPLSPFLLQVHVYYECITIA